MNSGKETITLRWSMDDESWSHWAQGRGKQTVSAVVLEGLHAIQENQDALESIRSCITKKVIPEEQESSGQDTQEPHRIKVEIQLSAADWGDACQRVGKPNGDDPVHPRQLLAAMILESESWKQSKNDDGSYDSGWNLDSLISSVALSAELTHTKGINLAKQETIMALIVTTATVVSALAASAAALIAFLAPQ